MIELISPYPEKTFVGDNDKYAGCRRFTPSNDIFNEYNVFREIRNYFVICMKWYNTARCARNKAGSRWFAQKICTAHTKRSFDVVWG
mmetsp:Transcript_45175/g.52911  ORF Transcript_45175/g.52911 Transcript_45175/m.52911 type:complete len:87 (-) Transcript_45175:2252-2512(-)